MHHRRVTPILLTTLAATILAACNSAVPVQVVNPTANPARPIATEAPGAPAPTAAALLAAQPISLGVSGSGEIRAAQEAGLVFLVPGTVAEVLVEEGQEVAQDQLLAVLDTRQFDLDIQRAEAGLALARAQAQALDENPRATDIAAADAAVRQAEALLAAVKAGPKAQDLEAAQAAVNAARANLQATKDRLSAARTSAELQLQQTANTVRNAQEAYQRIYWENRRTEEQLARFSQELPQAARDAEAQAQRGAQNAEIALQLAQVQLDQARQGEITGIEAAQQQLTQAEATLEKLQLPVDQDRLAAAEAGLAQAVAARARLTTLASQRAQAEAGIAQAEAGLALARLNRERAELRAPFDGVVASIAIDPGDPATSALGPAILVVDVSALRVDVRISDVDIAGVRIGQPATILVDALPGEQYTGTVSYIAPTATTLGTIRTFLVRISLDRQDNLRAGMSARVDLGQ